MSYMETVLSIYKIPQDTLTSFRKVVDHIKRAAKIAKYNDIEKQTRTDMEFSWFFLHTLFRDGKLIDLNLISELCRTNVHDIMMTIEKYLYVWLEMYCTSVYNIIRCYGSVLSLTRAEFFHLIFIIGRMYSVYRVQKIPLMCQEYDEVQIAATLLFFKYWKSQTFHIRDLATCFQDKYLFSPQDLTGMEIFHLQLFLDADHHIYSSKDRTWVEYEKTVCNDADNKNPMAHHDN